MRREERVTCEQRCYRFRWVCGYSCVPLQYVHARWLHVLPVSGYWWVWHYGDPPPFIEFFTPAGTFSVTDGGSTFGFTSIDLYSSVTEIPYTFTGLLDGNTVFTASGDASQYLRQFRVST
jgi:hypothetical protein